MAESSGFDAVHRACPQPLALRALRSLCVNARAVLHRLESRRVLQVIARPIHAVCDRRRGIQLVTDQPPVGGLMNNSRAVAATVVGAVIGGAAGYLFFTDHGRSLRRQIEPALDDFARELMSFRGTVQKAAGVAKGGWKLLNDELGENKQPPRHAGPHR